MTEDRTAGGRRESIGVLGGTFDPPHIGHAIVARDLLEGIPLDRLLVIPAFEPPHRETVLPAAVRLDLVRRLFAGVEGVEVSDLEFRRGGPSYTIDTLEELRERYPDADLTLILGADQFAVFDTWKDWVRIPDLARIAVMRREGGTLALPDGVDPIAYIAVHVTRIDISASRIRDRLARGASIRFLVPEPIRPDVERAWSRSARAESMNTEC